MTMTKQDDGRIAMRVVKSHNSARCDDCGEPVIWVTLDSGSKTRLSKTLQLQELLEPLAHGIASVVLPVKLSHFVTCPKSSWRRR